MRYQYLVTVFKKNHHENQWIGISCFNYEFKYTEKFAFDSELKEILNLVKSIICNPEDKFQMTEWIHYQDPKINDKRRMRWICSAVDTEDDINLDVIGLRPMRWDLGGMYMDGEPNTYSFICAIDEVETKNLEELLNEEKMRNVE